MMRKSHFYFPALLIMSLGLAACHEVTFRPPSAYVSSFIENDSIHFNTMEYRWFRVYFKEQSYTANQLNRVKGDLNDAMSRIFSVLSIDEYSNGIYLIAVDSKEEMQDLMGYRIKGGAAVGHDLVFFVFNELIRPQFRHEIFHLLAFEIWGPPSCRLLDEGGATYTDNICFYENPMYTINAGFMQENLLFNMKDLIDNFDELARQDDVIAYIQSAGIFKYLYENYGVEKMKQLWADGFENFDVIYGFSVETLESDWLNTIRQIPVPVDFDLDMLVAGCG